MDDVGVAALEDEAPNITEPLTSMESSIKMNGANVMLSKKYCAYFQDHSVTSCAATYFKCFRCQSRQSRVPDVISLGHFILIAPVEGICVQHHQAERKNIRLIYGAMRM